MNNPFTVEETNLICIFQSDSRTKVIEDIHNKISQDLEEKLWDIEDEYGVSLDTDKILEKTITISIRKYGNR